MKASLFLLILAAGLLAGCSSMREITSGLHDPKGNKGFWAQHERWSP